MTLRLLLPTFVVALMGLVPALRAQNTGSITGMVYDAVNGQPIRQASIEVTGANASTSKGQTNTDGSFSLSVPVGTYKLRFTAPNYTETTVDAVEVVAGQPVEASTVMSPKGATTTVEVNEKVGAVASTAEAAMAERKLAAVVSDSISNEELRSGTASNAAGALERVTGVSIVDNGFVYVRGLGERYSTTQLNNAFIPTTEPERRVVPLDLFPAALIDNIRILKTYTPDLPGEFSGGLVDMKTVEFPSQPVLRFSGTAGFNTVTTFDRFLTYPGGSRDVFGFGDDTRSIPAGIPRNQRVFQGRFTPQELSEFGRQFPVNWQPTSIGSMRPNQSYNIVAGNTFGRVGLVGAISFNNKPQVYNEQRRYYRTANAQPILFTRYDGFLDNVETAKMGAVGNVAIRLTPSNKIVFRNTITHDSDKESRIISGFDGSQGSEITDERLRWVERALGAHSIEGEHSLARIGNSLIRWQFTYSRSTRDEPDLREVIRSRTDDGRFQFVQQPLSGQRFYNNLADRIYEPQVEWSTPFFRGGINGLFKTGLRATLRSRDFEARRFRFIPFQTVGLNLFAPSNELFATQNIRPNGFQLIENTRATDRYDASMDIYAGFAMVDLNLGSRWRVVGGVRVEDADIRVTTLDPLIPNAAPAVANLANRDPLPGVNVIYALTPRQNLRFGFSRTIARPDFRELSPFDFTNVVGGFNTVGNPNLQRTTINNVDVRWEWFPGGSQIVAASYFLKDFSRPIEVAVQVAGDLRQTFLNADGATNQGVELEFRQGLGFVSRRLTQFALQANATLVTSSVQIPGDGVLTSTDRPLVGQSRYIFNAVAEWNRPQWRSNARFYANSVSRRITDVGTFQLPDIYQERNVLLDFVYQVNLSEDARWVVRFAGSNLGDNTYRWTQGGLLFREFQVGRTFEAGLSFNFF